MFGVEGLQQLDVPETETQHARAHPESRHANYQRSLLKASVESYSAAPIDDSETTAYNEVMYASVGNLRDFGETRGLDKCTIAFSLNQTPAKSGVKKNR